MAVSIVNGPRSAAKPRTSFDQQAADRGLVKPFGRRNAGRTATDHDDFNISRHHTSCMEVWASNDELILHLHQIKPVRRGDLPASAAVARGKSGGKIVNPPLVLADMDERADHRTDLMLQE